VLGTGAVNNGKKMSKHHKQAKVNYRKLWESINGPIPKGYHIHHKDGNPYNNSIDNLECLSPEEHAKPGEEINNV